MQFRWVALITLWTLFIGPVLGPPMPSPAKSARSHTVTQPTASARVVASGLER
jgi:hypothetical protein